jgi:hypothetical protein
MSCDIDLGRVATRGSSFRARAEARQREFRVEYLDAGWSGYGHWLDPAAAAAGRNFVVNEAFLAARERAAAGKGVADRTFKNMLSSQAMCFNLFTPLAQDLALATDILQPFLPGLRSVRRISFEFTPPAEVFRDQSGHGGVDCDLLVEADWEDGAGAVVAIETKFVEPEFSTCGFRKAGRAARGQAVCPDGVPVRADSHKCLYSCRKGYHYWEQTKRAETLSSTALPDVGCPFAGPEWQLWVNHTLVHALSERFGAKHAIFAVCAPVANRALLGGNAVGSFRERLARPETLRFIELDHLIQRIGTRAERLSPPVVAWGIALARRYGGI